jgi:dTDP-4-amino-4,6-dideoxygalactose transaminase
MTDTDTDTDTDTNAGTAPGTTDSGIQADHDIDADRPATTTPTAPSSPPSPLTVSRRDTTSSALAVQGGTPVRDDLLVFGRPTIGSAEVEEVTATLGSGWLGSGPRVAAFETALGTYLGTPGVVAVGSGTAALHLAMLAAGIGPGDEVIVPSMTFAATANAVIHAGATPVLVDVDPHTQNIDVDRVEAAIGPRTAAVVPVHFAGFPCPMDRIEALTRPRDITLIEDAAHCIEGWAQGRKVGTIGDATCFSFYVTKNITTVEGGLVATPRADWLDGIRTHALHGLSGDAWTRFADTGYAHYEVVTPGFKYNMTDLHAAIGLRQLTNIERWSRRRAALWSRYDEALADLPVDLPALPEAVGDVHARHLYVLRLRLGELRVDRDTVLQALHAENIGVGVHYVALHLQPYHRTTTGLRPEDLPVATDLSRRTLSIPFSPGLSDADADDVVTAVRKVLDAYRA